MNLRIVRSYANTPPSVRRDHVPPRYTGSPDNIERAKNRHTIRSTADGVEAAGIRAHEITLNEIATVSLPNLDSDSITARRVNGVDDVARRRPRCRREHADL